MFLYQMPKYRVLELPGLKNPISKAPAAEMRVLLAPSAMVWFGVKVSSDADEMARREIVKLEQNRMMRVCAINMLFLVLSLVFILFKNFFSRASLDNLDNSVVNSLFFVVPRLGLNNIVLIHFFLLTRRSSIL